MNKVRSRNFGERNKRDPSSETGWPKDHSCLSESTGFIFAAFLAG